MIEFKDINRFIVKNLVISVCLIIFMPILGIIFGLMQYSPSGSADDFYWISPALSILPISYLIREFFYLLKKDFKKSLFMSFIFLYFSLAFIKIYNYKSISSDFKILFHQKNK